MTKETTKKTKKTKKTKPCKSESWTVEQWAVFGSLVLTKATMAYCLGCSTKTIQREFEKDDEDGAPTSEFVKAYLSNKGETQKNILGAQIDCALVERNPSMLMFLGKVLCDQRENAKVDPEEFDGNVTINGVDISKIEFSPKK